MGTEITPQQLFPGRKEQELRFKLSSLSQELETWHERSQLHHAFEKNHSQITRLTLQIKGLQARLDAELTMEVNNGNLLLRAESLERKALALHAIWDFFRCKLCLREVEPFSTYLTLADAYARECYLPTLQFWRNEPKEALCPAPLITFDIEISPWARYGDPEQRPAIETGLLTSTQFNAAVKRLPLTLLGLPWSFFAYLPHMSLLAHEVGHALERDLAIGIVLDRAMESAPIADNSRRPAWMAWRSEVFADLFACWAGGSAFLWALAEQLARESDQIQSQRLPRQNGEWTRYPTTSLRVLLACRFLQDFGFAEQANEVRQHWLQEYPIRLLASFEDDLSAISAALANAARLNDISGKFTPALLSSSQQIANVYGADSSLRDDDPRAARAYVTAARLLMSKTNNATTALAEQWRKIATHHLRSQPPGLAGSRHTGEINEDQERRIGEGLAEVLFADL